MENNDNNYWIDTASSVETNERRVTTEEDRIQTPKKKNIVYSKREARSIAYRFLRHRFVFRRNIFVFLPLLLIDIIGSTISSVIYEKEILKYVIVVSIILLAILIGCTVYSYKEYHKEERRLIKLYGKEFVRQASLIVS